MGRWPRHLFQKKESIKTTWKLRLAIVLLPLLVIPLTRSFWSTSIGQSLTCTENIGRSDIILVENIDPDCLLFERAATVRHAGLASRVLVPVQVSHDSARANSVSFGVADVMARGTLEQPRQVIATPPSD